MDVRGWYDRSYLEEGFHAQRLYPNEELLRFLGRHYFASPRAVRAGIRILEVGCGSGANLWMIAREGFDAHGIDLSPESLALCRRMLDHWQVTATLATGDMSALAYPDASVDAVCDVFSSYCLDERGAADFFAEAARVLRPGGRFFTYTPSQASDVFRNPAPSARLDDSTLDGIRRPDAPFSGNLYPFRFTTAAKLAAGLDAAGLIVTRSETVGRSYRGGAEHFEFVVVDAVKP